MWSRLEGSLIWEEARAAYAVPGGRLYHDFGHVLRLYEIAAEKGLAHDPALDLAILAHDVIYDRLPLKERRSADWLLERAPASLHEDWVSAADMIMTTERHSPGDDDRLALLDLHDLGDLQVSIDNREKLAAEAEALCGTSREAFGSGNAAFMRGMAERIEAGLDATIGQNRAEWERVASGIRALLAHDSPAPESP